MKTSRALVCTLFLVSVTSHAETETTSAAAAAVETPAFALPTATADVTWSSQYIMDGFNIGGDHPVIQPSLRVATPLEGVSAMFWSSIQTDRDNQQYDEFDLMARYSHDFMADTKFAFNVHGYYDYWVFPKLETAPGSSMKGSKLNIGASATRLVPIAGSYLVPSYNLYYWAYWAQNNLNLWEGGAHHEFMLDYFHETPRFLPGLQSQYLGVTGSMNYIDGVFGSGSGWSHSVLGLTAIFYALNSEFFASVDPNNELWSTLSFTKQF